MIDIVVQYIPSENKPSKLPFQGYRITAHLDMEREGCSVAEMTPLLVGHTLSEPTYSLNRPGAPECALEDMLQLLREKNEGADERICPTEESFLARN